MPHNIRRQHLNGQPDRVFFLCGILMLCSEAAKQLVLTFVLGNGYYNWWYFPFQLCSIPMYILLLLPWIRRPGMRRTLLCFLMCYSLLGGIAVFADTSGLHYPIAILTFHSYTWHIVLILLGLFSGAVFFRSSLSGNSAHIPVRNLLHPFAGSTTLYLLCCAAAECLNLSLDRFGTINMFYINPDYRMQQVVFRDISMLIGNRPCIALYICATVLGAFLLLLVWFLLFRLFPRFFRRLDILLRNS